MSQSPPSTLAPLYASLAARVREVDELRWLSSRYATPAGREALITLYAYYYELARVRLVASDQTLGQIRFQWWRETLESIAADAPREHDVTRALAEQIQLGALQLDALQRLIEQSEMAFLAADRSLEPEPLLTRIAAHTLSTEAELDAEFEVLVTEWAALRRGDFTVSKSPPARLHTQQAPALAHLRVRRLWHRTGTAHQSQPVRQRLCILRAVQSGWV